MARGQVQEAATSFAVQWLRLRAPNARGHRLSPWSGELRSLMSHGTAKKKKAASNQIISRLGLFPSGSGKALEGFEQ